MMTKMEQAIEILLAVERDVDSQIHNMVIDVVSGDTDKKYLDRKRAALHRSIDDRFDIIYKILESDDKGDAGDKE